MNGPIDPPCTDVIVVRHGETDWNAFGKIQVDFSNFSSFLTDQFHHSPSHVSTE